MHIRISQMGEHLGKRQPHLIDGPDLIEPEGLLTQKGHPDETGEKTEQNRKSRGW